MSEQLRNIIERALADGRSEDPAVRQDIYAGVRRRLVEHIAARPQAMPEAQKHRLAVTLEQIIDEFETRFAATVPVESMAGAIQTTEERSHMTTEPNTPPEPKKRGGTGAAIATLAVVAVAAAGGTYWWSQQHPYCQIGSETASLKSLHFMQVKGSEFSVTGADPRMVFVVPADNTPCVQVSVTVPVDEELTVYLPDEHAEEDVFVSSRSISRPVSSGNNVVNIKLPSYVASRTIRIDPVAGESGSVAGVYFGKFK